MPHNWTQQADLELVGVSDVVRDVSALVDTIALSDCSVLIEGESGTGKDLVAKRLHARSPRSLKPFVPVNCGGISETLFESQFFGHVRGAFTGAEESMLGLVRAAEGGTLFIDEVGEMPLGMQPKLLRVLQDGEVMPLGTASSVTVDVRFVAATNQKLVDRVREQRFREDLYYRINVVRIRMPALRERPEDVSPLLDHFCARCAERHGRPVIHISDQVRRELTEYRWPGNVRELISWIQRLYATGLSPEILTESLLGEQEELGAGRLMTLEEAEHQAIALALDATGNNRSEAARILNINRGTLLRKIAHHGVE